MQIKNSKVEKVGLDKWVFVNSQLSATAVCSNHYDYTASFGSDRKIIFNVRSLRIQVPFQGTEHNL